MRMFKWMLKNAMALSLALFHVQMSYYGTASIINIIVGKIYLL